jgi:hypothetical protein
VIAVLAREADHPVVREFFELFKTPWEFYRSDRQYEVLICADDRPPNISAKLVLIYGGEPKLFDQKKEIQVRTQSLGTVLSYKNERIPIYGNCLAFGSSENHWLVDANTGKPVVWETASNGQKLVWFGFDLFYEIRYLLTRGQPVAHAGTPTLEIHIALLRELIIGCAIPLVEILPVPENYNFIACLTHDVDHAGIRNHKWDHTMFGFLYRATVGSLMDVFSGKKSAKQLMLNWRAAFSLPFVHLGLTKDFWYQFDRYLGIEKGLNSTFFVIPIKNDPGQIADGLGHAKRAVRYDIAEIKDQLQRVLVAGHEIGLHGIDAWCDSAKGREERQCISHLTHSPEVGVRMHWLYFDEQSPATLEQAGFSYDSTVGYNETVGYRAGTTQAFLPLQLTKMIELPMHVMDTALFFPSYLGLSPKDAEGVFDELIENAARFGGALTVNWHDRSIAPERLWDNSYIKLLDELKGRNAWFATASQTVSWFRKRRSATIENVSWEDGAVKIKASLISDDRVPGLRIRVHSGKTQDSVKTESSQWVEVPFNENLEARIVFKTEQTETISAL